MIRFSSSKKVQQPGLRCTEGTRELPLTGSSVDFGSTAGLAAVLSKANGNAIKGVYVYSQPEWSALVEPVFANAVIK